MSFTYDFPKPGTKALATKETLEARVGKQACGVSYFKTSVDRSAVAWICDGSRRSV